MRRLLAYLIFAGVISACSAPQRTATNTTPERELTESEKIQFDKKFFDAQKEKALGNWEKVVKLYSTMRILSKKIFTRLVDIIN